MADVVPEDEQANYETLRECLSEPVLRALAATTPKKAAKKKRERKRKVGSREKNDLVDSKGYEELREFVVNAEGKEENDAEDLGEFIDYLASLIFPSLPQDLRTLNYAIYQATPSLRETYSSPIHSNTTESLMTSIPPSAIDSLTSYSLLPSPDPDAIDLRNFLTPILETYISTTTSRPPVWANTRTTYCELCERSWIPLTYHHLIPRSMHARALKRGWHTEDRLNSVAWLCRACHGFVHRGASNEELARKWWTVEMLRGREDMEGWIRWVGKIRWKKR